MVIIISCCCYTYVDGGGCYLFVTKNHKFPWKKYYLGAELELSACFWFLFIFLLSFPPALIISWLWLCNSSDSYLCLACPSPTKFIYFYKKKKKKERGREKNILSLKYPQTSQSTLFSNYAVILCEFTIVGLLTREIIFALNHT